ncbi:FAM172 family protein homolog CG10038 [Musca vetustissima]|uniref:FAM172 family protein homolog CG10038 n=1 Tax=Musca vetustissima TaxID=27455 RepID=UPI002AB652C5|nr:FAM172 family protein homolog CG10038 [Musca vetustissima]
MSKLLRNWWASFPVWRTSTRKLKTTMSVDMSSSGSTSPTSKSGQALQKLKEFGYAFNSAGQLRKIDKTTGEVTDEPFEFDVYKDHAKNQAHYEKLADQIPEIVYDLLEQNGLTRTYIPEQVPADEATFFFTKPEQLDKPKKLIVIIHGSGYVRAGQWARSLIINNSLDHGTQIPYIRRAEELGYDILVTNTNDNYRIVDGKRKPIQGLSSATSHAAHVWEKYVMACEPEAVAIVAHSAGGGVTLDLARRYPEFFQNKVFAIALTDSAHFGISGDIRKIIAGKTCNWVSSSEPLDTEIKTSKDDIKMVSAGHTKHEWTSYSAFESVFNFLEDKYAEFSGEQKSKKQKLEE